MRTVELEALKVLMDKWETTVPPNRGHELEKHILEACSRDLKNLLSTFTEQQEGDATPMPMERVALDKLERIIANYINRYSEVAVLDGFTVGHGEGDDGWDALVLSEAEWTALAKCEKLTGTLIFIPEAKP